MKYLSQKDLDKALLTVQEIKKTMQNMTKLPIIVLYFRTENLPCFKNLQ